MRERDYPTLPCHDTCPFGHTCGMSYFKEKQPCVTHVDKIADALDAQVGMVQFATSLHIESGPALDKTRHADISEGIVFANPDEEAVLIEHGLVYTAPPSSE